MAGSGFIRVGTITGAARLRAAVAHNARELPHSADNIDPTREGLNFALTPATTSQEVTALADELVGNAGCAFKRKDAVRAVEFIFSLPAGSVIDPRAYFTACIEWAGAFFRTPLLCAHVHLDEAAPHCHALMLPLRDGALLGARMIGDRKAVHAMRAAFSAVAARHGLKAAPARLTGASKRDAIKAVIDALKASKSRLLSDPQWDCVRQGIEADPQPWMDALGIEPRAQARKLRTMAAVFTSPGKGPKFEREAPGR